MAHIAAWERVAYDIVQAARDSEPLKDYVSEAFESIHNFNTQIYEKNEDRSLSEVQAEFQADYQKFITLVARLDDRFIASNLPFEGAENLHVQAIISSNTYHHYREHAKALDELS